MPAENALRFKLIDAISQSNEAAMGRPAEPICEICPLPDGYRRGLSSARGRAAASVCGGIDRFVCVRTTLLSSTVICLDIGVHLQVFRVDADGEQSSSHSTTSYLRLIDKSAGC